MSITGGHLDALLAAGATAEQIVALVKADMEEREAKLTARREKDAVRQRRKRSRGVTRTERDKGSNDRDILTSQVQVSEPSGSSPSPRAWALPVGVSFQVWTDFLTNRKRKKQPNTDTAWKAFNDDLARVSAQTGIPPPKLVEMCAAKGWGGIYDPTENQSGKRSGQSGWEQAYASVGASGHG